MVYSNNFFDDRTDESTFQHNEGLYRGYRFNGAELEDYCYYEDYYEELELEAELYKSIEATQRQILALSNDLATLRGDY